MILAPDSFTLAREFLRWTQAEREWKGVLTLQTLLSLRSYGRLPAIEHKASAPTYSLASG